MREVGHKGHSNNINISKLIHIFAYTALKINNKKNKIKTGYHACTHSIQTNYFLISHFLGALAKAFVNQVYDLANLRTYLNRGGNEEGWRRVE